MKRFIPLTLIPLTLLVSCAPNPGPRVAALEQKLSVLESNLAHLKFSYYDSWTNQHEINLGVADVMEEMTTSQGLNKTMFGALTWQAATNEARIQNVENILTRARLFGPRPVYAPTSNGVPVEVYNQIFSQARLRYPTDYDMQDFIVRDQIKAYKKLHP